MYALQLAAVGVKSSKSSTSFRFSAASPSICCSTVTASMAVPSWVSCWMAKYSAR